MNEFVHNLNSFWCEVKWPSRGSEKVVRSVPFTAWLKSQKNDDASYAILQAHSYALASLSESWQDAKFCCHASHLLRKLCLLCDLVFPELLHTQFQLANHALLFFQPPAHFLDDGLLCHVILGGGES